MCSLDEDREKNAQMRRHANEWDDGEKQYLISRMKVKQIRSGSLEMHPLLSASSTVVQDVKSGKSLHSSSGLHSHRDLEKAALTRMGLSALNRHRKFVEQRRNLRSRGRSERTEIINADGVQSGLENVTVHSSAKSATGRAFAASLPVDETTRYESEDDLDSDANRLDFVTRIEQSTLHALKHVETAACNRRQNLWGVGFDSSCQEAAQFRNGKLVRVAPFHELYNAFPRFNDSRLPIHKKEGSISVVEPLRLLGKSEPVKSTHVPASEASQTSALLATSNPMVGRYRNRFHLAAGTGLTALETMDSGPIEADKNNLISDVCDFSPNSSLIHESGLKFRRRRRRRRHSSSARSQAPVTINQRLYYAARKRFHLRSLNSSAAGSELSMPNGGQAFPNVNSQELVNHDQLAENKFSFGRSPFKVTASRFKKATWRYREWGNHSFGASDVDVKPENEYGVMEPELSEEELESFFLRVAVSLSEEALSVAAEEWNLRTPSALPITLCSGIPTRRHPPWRLPFRFSLRISLIPGEVAMQLREMKLQKMLDREEEMKCKRQWISRAADSSDAASKSGTDKKLVNDMAELNAADSGGPRPVGDAVGVDNDFLNTEKEEEEDKTEMSEDDEDVNDDICDSIVWLNDLEIDARGWLLFREPAAAYLPFVVDEKGDKSDKKYVFFSSEREKTSKITFSSVLNPLRALGIRRRSELQDRSLRLQLYCSWPRPRRLLFDADCAIKPIDEDSEQEMDDGLSLEEDESESSGGDNSNENSSECEHVSLSANDYEGNSTTSSTNGANSSAAVPQIMQGGKTAPSLYGSPGQNSDLFVRQQGGVDSAVNASCEVIDRSGSLAEFRLNETVRSRILARYEEEKDIQDGTFPNFGSVWQGPFVGAPYPRLARFGSAKIFPVDPNCRGTYAVASPSDIEGEVKLIEARGRFAEKKATTRHPRQERWNAAQRRLSRVNRAAGVDRRGVLPVDTAEKNDSILYPRPLGGAEFVNAVCVSATAAASARIAESAVRVLSRALDHADGDARKAVKLRPFGATDPKAADCDRFSPTGLIVRAEASIAEAAPPTVAELQRRSLREGIEELSEVNRSGRWLAFFGGNKLTVIPDGVTNAAELVKVSREVESEDVYRYYLEPTRVQCTAADKNSKSGCQSPNLAGKMNPELPRVSQGPEYLYCGSSPSISARAHVITKPKLENMSIHGRYNQVNVNDASKFIAVSNHMTAYATSRPADLGSNNLINSHPMFCPIPPPMPKNATTPRFRRMDLK